MLEQNWWRSPLSKIWQYAIESKKGVHSSNLSIFKDKNDDISFFKGPCKSSIRKSIEHYEIAVSTLNKNLTFCFYRRRFDFHCHRMICIIEERNFKSSLKPLDSIGSIFSQGSRFSGCRIFWILTTASGTLTLSESWKKFVIFLNFGYAVLSDLKFWYRKELNLGHQLCF